MKELCLNWRKAKSAAGYGQKQHNGKVCYVHRLEWEKAHGPIPKGMCVLHKCDNPACYRLSHLFLGTKADNSKDMAVKRRQKHKLSPEAIADIRVKGKRTFKQLAAKYGVSLQAVHYTYSRRNNKHI